MPFIAGEVIHERYRIDDLLAQGGMSAVYKAWDLRLQVACALKEMVPYPGLEERALTQMQAQFLQEAQVLAELRHSNMPRVTDHFEDEGNAYLVMDYVEGQRLDTIIEEEGALPPETILDWARELLEALKYCHTNGIIHRDVKPQNVIITPEGRAMLVDFGLVKLLNMQDRRTRTVMRGLGTPEYAPPEQYDSEIGSTDERTDVYGLGATLYHALTGTPPPTATQRIVNPELLKPLRHYTNNIPQEIENAIVRSLALQPTQRFGTINEMAEALFGSPVVKPSSRPLGSGTQSSTNPLGTVVLARLRRVSGPLWWAGAGGVATVLTLMFFVLRGVLPLGGSETATPSPTIAIAVATDTATPSPRPPTSTPTATWTPTSAPSRTPTATRTPTMTPTPTETPSPTSELAGTTETTCTLDVELVEVKDPFNFWYTLSFPIFDLILRNVGTCPWPEDTQLKLVSENPLNWQEQWEIGAVEAEAIITSTIQLVAPSTPQILTIVWQLEDPAEQPIGAPITYTLRIEPRPTVTPTPAPTSTPRLTPTSGSSPTQPTTPSTPSRTPTPGPTPTPTTVPTATDTPVPPPTPTFTPRPTGGP